MENAKIRKTLDSTNAFFDETLTDIDLNLDINEFYRIIDSDKVKNKLEQQVDLSNLRDENYRRYNNINIFKYNDLPEEFSSATKEIINLYNCIDINNILNDDFESSNNNKIIIDNIYRRIYRLDNMVKSYLNELTIQNDESQKKFSLAYFNSLNVNEQLKKELIKKYNKLVLKSSFVSDDIYDELNFQIARKSHIDEILYLLNIEEKNNADSLMNDRLKVLNIVINLEIQRFDDKIHYLEDLMPESSKYINEFNDFKEFYNKVIAYDDTDYEVARQTLDILINDGILNKRIETFEELFIDEINSINVENKFIYEKIGIKNIETSLNYIKTNYSDKLNEENQNIINYINDKINSESYDIDELNKTLKLIVREIWNNQITDVYNFNPNEDYYFICSNNQFIDPKYQTILITKKEIERVDDYEDYQIGFICGYNDNILYMTENDDIMTVDNDDMSNLKTPLQLEQEFINFRICNRIALDGYITKIEAVYLIDDGNMDKYIKAVELANMYNLPLIKFKKEKE